MLSSPRLTVVTILLTSTLSSGSTSAEISKRSRYFEDARRDKYTVYYESKNRGKRESDRGEERNTEEVQNSWLESTVEELADATGSNGYAGHSNAGNYANRHESNRRSIGGRWQHDSVPGTPGMDYPNHETIPVTTFTCMDKEPGGYYADVETGCQVFHVCNTGGTKSSFMCPPGSIFNQKYFVCDWWYRFDCNDALDNNKKEKQDDFRYSSSQPQVIYEKDENKPTIVEKFEETKNFDKEDEKYSKNTRIRDYNPPNDLSPAGSGERGSDHSRQATRGNDESSRESANNVPADSRKYESRKNQEKINDNVPRGFSRDRDESSSEKTDVRSSQQDSTNDLASFINYSYFEAKLNNNDNYGNFDNNNNNNNNNNNRGKNESEDDWRIEINFGKKSN